MIRLETYTGPDAIELVLEPAVAGDIASALLKLPHDAGRIALISDLFIALDTLGYVTVGPADLSRRGRP